MPLDIPVPNFAETRDKLRDESFRKAYFQAAIERGGREAYEKAMQTFFREDAEPISKFLSTSLFTQKELEGYEKMISQKEQGIVPPSQDGMNQPTDSLMPSCPTNSRPGYCGTHKSR